MLDRPPGSRSPFAEKILIALIFSILGYFGNVLSIQVAFGVAFIFGSIFAILALSTLGCWWGLGVSLIASSYTYLLWNHPYAIVIFTAEILWIALLSRRGMKNILLIDSLYWLILGIPLVILFYAGAQHLDAPSVALIALKQPLNGVFNALAASIILSHTPLRNWISREKHKHLTTYATIIFHLIAAALIIPSLGLLLYMNHRQAASDQTLAIESVREKAHEARAFIQEWVDNHVNAVRITASLGEEYPFRPSPELQEELKQILALFPDFHNVFLGDASATTIAFYPPVNERGESTVGINFADRAWFKQLKSTLEPVVSEVFVGRGGVFSAIFSISAPVVRNHNLVGFGLGAVNLEKLSDHITKFGGGGTLSIIDRNGNIIVSNDETRKPLTPQNELETGTIVPMASDVSLWVPGKIKNVSVMKTWVGAYYFNRTPIEGTSWTLMTEIPLEPTQKHLYDFTIWSLGGVAILFGLALFLCHVLSRRLSGAFEFFSVATKDFPSKIEQQKQIEWPTAITAEMDQLIRNFKDTEIALRKHIRDVKRANESLEQKVRERTHELDSERNRMRNIIEGTNVGTWEWNVQTGELIVNERWAEIIGYDLRELEPVNIRTWIDTAHPDDLEASKDLLEKHFKGELDYYEFECRMKHKDGHWVYVFDRGKVISWTADSKPHMMFGTHTDITDRKRAEAERRNLNERIRQVEKTESLGRMAGAIAHNFNNQLFTITGNLEMALNNLSEDSTTAKLLNAAMGAALRSSEISGLMLTYLGQGSVLLEVIDLSESCRRFLPSIQNSLGEDILFETDLMASGPVVRANSDQVRQILNHLIKNAAEAIGPRKGKITLAVNTVDASDVTTPHISFTDWKPEADVFACIEVSDTGDGILDKDMDKIFDPFFTTRFTGRGLGLAVVLGIVRAWKGCISVESEKDRGSRFRTFIPLTTPKK